MSSRGSELHKSAWVPTFILNWQGCALSQKHMGCVFSIGCQRKELGVCISAQIQGVVFLLKNMDVNIGYEFNMLGAS